MIKVKINKLQNEKMYSFTVLKTARRILVTLVMS